MRRLWLSIVGIGVVLGAIVVFRAASLEPLPASELVPIEIEVDPSPTLDRYSEALRFRTISHASDSGETFDRAAFVGFRQFLERSYPTVHATLEREIVSDYSLLFTWPGSDRTLEPVVLMGHFDVVPADPATLDRWTHPPFDGRVADGYIWGRGAFDDKLNVVGLLEAAEKLAARGFAPERTILLAFGHDEELGGTIGAASIAERVAERHGRVALVVDEGGALLDVPQPGVEAPIAVIGVAEKGYVSVELVVETKGGHSSVPPESTTIGILATAIHRLERNPLPARFDQAWMSLEAVAPAVTFPYRLVLRNRWLFGPVLRVAVGSNAVLAPMLRTTTAATIFHAGVKDNVLPSVAAATVNFRIFPGDTIASVVEHVREVVDDARIRITPTAKQREASKVSNVGGVGWGVLVSTLRGVYPDAVPTPFLIPGGTDARYFRELTDSAFGFMPARLPPGDFRRAHGLDERLSVDSYLEGIRFYAQLLHEAGTWR